MSGKWSFRGALRPQLGPVFLGRVVVLVALFLIYVVYLQSSVLFKSRRHARELLMQRELAEHAEISRLTELRSFVEAQLPTPGTEIAQSRV